MNLQWGKKYFCKPAANLTSQLYNPPNESELIYRDAHVDSKLPHKLLYTHKPAMSAQALSVWISGGGGSVRWRLVALNPLLSFLPLFSHSYPFYPHTCSLFHTPPFSLTLCLILTLHLCLANSWLISCHLPTQLSQVLTFSTTSRFWPSGQGGKMKGAQH